MPTFTRAETTAPITAGGSSGTSATTAPTVVITGPPPAWTGTPGPSADPGTPGTPVPVPEPWTGGTFGYEVEGADTSGGISISPDYVVTFPTIGAEFAQGLLDDGEQLVIHKAYYSTPPEDIYGFFSPFSGFGMTQKNTVYNDFSIDTESSRTRGPGQVGGDALWAGVGEEPIYYQDAEIVDAKSSEDSSWETFLDFVGDVYENTPFTCYREYESYLDWYDYSEEHFEFGFTYKQEAAEYMQANHLRSVNKPWAWPGGIFVNYFLNEQPLITTTSLTSPFTSRYGVSDEEPAIIGWWGADEDGDGVGDIPMYDSGFSAVLLPGYQHISFLYMFDNVKEDLALRFKTKTMVETTSAEFLNSRIQYVINSGYRTVLKRRLTSKSQKVRRFLRREFTSLSGMYPTIFYESPTPMGPAGVTEATTPLSPTGTGAGIVTGPVVTGAPSPIITGEY